MLCGVFCSRGRQSERGNVPEKRLRCQSTECREESGVGVRGGGGLGRGLMVAVITYSGVVNAEE